VTRVALVRFVTEEGEFAIPVERVSGVRGAEAIHALPDARRDMAGLLHAEGRPIPVLSALGHGGGHVLVLRTAAPDAAIPEFGLLVREVRGVIRVDQAAVFGPPEGQRAGLCSGVVVHDGELVLIADVAVLARALWEGGDPRRMASSPGPPSPGPPSMER